MAQETTVVVLDLKRISEIDSTGGLALLEINALLAIKQKTLLLVAAEHSLAFKRLQDFEVLKTFPPAHIFADVDRAIEWTEDALLRDWIAPASEELPLTKIGLLKNFSEFQIAAITRRLVRVENEAGSVIFREGEPGQNLLMITKGTASAYLFLPNGEQIRLATFGPGTIFGELALLDEGLRSASVVADDNLICYSLSKADFAALAAEVPAVAIKLLASLGRELSGRLRVANRTIQQLEI